MALPGMGPCQGVSLIQRVQAFEPAHDVLLDVIAHVKNRRSKVAIWIRGAVNDAFVRFSHRNALDRGDGLVDDLFHFGRETVVIRSGWDAGRARRGLALIWTNNGVPTARSATYSSEICRPISVRFVLRRCH